MVSRPAYRPDGEAGNRASYSPIGAGTGAELGNNTKRTKKLLIVGKLGQIEMLD